MCESTLCSVYKTTEATISKRPGEKLQTVVHSTECFAVGQASPGGHWWPSLQELRKQGKAQLANMSTRHLLSQDLEKLVLSSHQYKEVRRWLASLSSGAPVNFSEADDEIGRYLYLDGTPPPLLPSLTLFQADFAKISFCWQEIWNWWGSTGRPTSKVTRAKLSHFASIHLNLIRSSSGQQFQLWSAFGPKSFGEFWIH